MAYYSKKLTPAERHYSATEVEGLAVVRGVQHFVHYLIGRHFRIETDHRALQFLQSARHLNGRLSRWALLLQSYDYEIHYRPGRSNSNADGLSRQSWEEPKDVMHDDGLHLS